MLRAIAVAAFALLVSCSEKKTVTMDEFTGRVVTLPNGTEILAEVMMHPTDMMRGMMFRDSLPEGRGMLFVHRTPGQHSYWMYQVRIPLDIIWLDGNKNVVEMSPDTPPCKARSSRDCPSYGGNQNAQFVLELPGGSIAKHGIKLGDRLSF